MWTAACRKLIFRYRKRSGSFEFGNLFLLALAVAVVLTALSRTAFAEPQHVGDGNPTKARRQPAPRRGSSLVLVLGGRSRRSTAPIPTRLTIAPRVRSAS